MSTPKPPAIPAATLILLRDRPGAPPELPMIGRGAHLVFAASRMVFPGGRVDADDRLLAERSDLILEGASVEADDLAHRIAAIRETVEEIGLAPGLIGVNDAGLLGELRAALHAGDPLSRLVEAMGLRIDPHALQPFARWRPELQIVRRFDTRFYIARAPDVGEARADGSESSHCVWGTAREHLSAGTLMFPTICNLERIAVADSYDRAVELARRYPVETVTPWIEDREDGRWLRIPDHLGYPLTAIPLAQVDRGAGPTSPSTTQSPG